MYLKVTKRKLAGQQPRSPSCIPSMLQQPHFSLHRKSASQWRTAGECFNPCLTNTDLNLILTRILRWPPSLPLDLHFVMSRPPAHIISESINCILSCPFIPRDRFHFQRYKSPLMCDRWREGLPNDRGSSRRNPRRISKASQNRE